MTTKQVLEKARGLISKKEDWTQGDLINEEGQVCAVGAVNAALNLPQDVNEYLVPENRDALSLLASTIGHGSGYEPDEVVFTYNDSHSHECVLAAFDAAIERAT